MITEKLVTKDGLQWASHSLTEKLSLLLHTCESELDMINWSIEEGQVALLTSEARP